jgi:hypothetical protein
MAPADLVLAGDFNCILQTGDSTGNVPKSPALDRLVRSIGLKDMWDASQSQFGSTHYAPLSATRLDRIYVTERPYQRKRGAETVIAAFSNHFAVILRLATDGLYQERGRGFGRMNISLLHDNTFYSEVARKWTEWARHKRYYPTIVLWWARFVKVKIRQLFAQEGTVQNRDFRTMENLYYAAMYAAVREQNDAQVLHTALHTLKGKLTRLHTETNKLFFLGAAEQIGVGRSVQHYST